MKLRSIRVKNVRCIEDIPIKIRDFTSLIGPNNCGKSSVLRAIELFLNQQSPDIEEWRKGHADKEMIIEGEFDELQDWEKTTPGIAGLVHKDKIQLRLRLWLDSATGKIEKIYEAFKPDETITGWSDKLSAVSPDIKAIADELGIDGKSWRGAAKQERVRQRIRETKQNLITLSEPKWSADNISIDAALQQALPQAQLIPAVRDAKDDGKPGAKTSFGLLLSRIILPAVQTSTEYQALLKAVEDLQGKLAAEGTGQIQQVGELTKLLSERLSSVIDAKVLLTMSTPDAEKFIGANTGLLIDDGTKTPIGLQGNGLQRALVFALMEVLASQNAQRKDEAGAKLKSRSSIILFEEPELFLHPHIMRRLKDALQKISKSTDWQVLVTTHSPFLIDVGEDPTSLVVFKRENSTSPPKVAQLESDPFGADPESQRDREALRAVLDFHPTVCEAFFAKRTVLVEGDSEKAVLVHQPDLYVKAQVDPAKRSLCTVVSCGGKWTIPPIANLLKRFEIPFRIIHDMDKKNRTPEELGAAAAIDPFKANERIAQFAATADIFVVDDTLEDLFWKERPKSSGDKPYRVWKRVKELCQNTDLLDEKIRKLLQFAFNW